MRRAATVLVLAFLAFPGCSAQKQTQIIIGVSTDIPSTRFDEVFLGIGYIQPKQRVTEVTWRLGPEIQLPDLDPTDGTRVFVERREDCTDGASVELYRVEGGGHTWPGGRPYAPQRIVGRTSHDIDASQVAFAFFASHSTR